MASLFEQRALRGTPDGASTGFSRAKKLASNAIKMNQPEGRPTIQGYEQAIAFLQNFVYSENEKESLAAQGLVAGYENRWKVLKQNEGKQGQHLGEFDNTEREIYFKIPFVNSSGELKEAPYDIPLRVSEIALDLTELRFSVEEKIIEGKELGEDVSSFEDYLEQLKPRQEIMVDLNTDYLNGTLSPQKLRDTVGIYTESDNEDGEIRNIGIMPIDNLPSDISKNKFKKLDSSSSYGNGYLQEFGNFIKGSDGITRHRQGNKVWDDGGIPSPEGLIYDKNSDIEFKNKPGTYEHQQAPFKIAGITPGKFARGVIGVDENNKTKWGVFYRDVDNTIYRLDDETLANYREDPNFAQDIRNADIIYDTELTSKMMTNVEPLTFKPITAGIKQREEEARLAPQLAEEERQKSLGFFGRFKERVATTKEAEASRPSFFERKNIPNKPDEVSTGLQVPDIINKGKEFFRTNPLTRGFFSQ